MLKPWSITTTVRNPERLKEFLVVLQHLAGQKWDNENQKNYQKLLIKHRLYGYGSPQFYNGLSKNVVDLINDTDTLIDDKTIERIITLKNYKDFAMRGRQSLNPLTKFGFAYIDNGIAQITELGNKLIENSQDFGDVFLKSFIKWQIPNPANDDFANDGNYEIVPFVATLKLIDEVNKLEITRGNNPVGLSKREFALFAPSLVKYSDISKYADAVIKFRNLQKGKADIERKKARDEYRQQFVKEVLGAEKQSDIDKLLDNLHDYGDNTIRYFRLTKFICIRGNGFYVDLEPNRRTEIEALFENEFYKPKSFDNKETYLNYMSDDSLPVLPWQTKNKLVRIAKQVANDVLVIQKELGLKELILQDVSEMDKNKLNSYVSDLREERKSLQEKKNHIQSQSIEAIEQYIEQLENIYSFENRALMLEYITTLGLHALNDAKEIKPNYPVGDDNEPASTATGGVADIECYYENFNMICEVTMLNGRDQWFNEGQPVMRHLRNFENINKNAYCVFIAPSIHSDSAETFWIANTIGYKGNKQKI
ncbi:MAG: AlwI family type II restriction endonuclease, partial [Endomicrobium sp.]|nr:AlwI family type II restriction endonuclease [Endomicrobium sp.]